MKQPTLNEEQPKSECPLNIAECLDRIKELDGLIAPLADERAKLNQKILETKSKFKTGDIIQWNKGASRGRVLEVRRWLGDDPMWKVQRILKDGSEGSTCEVRPYMDPVHTNS